MAALFSNIEKSLKQKSILSFLIGINIAVFLLIKIVGVVLLLFNADQSSILAWIELPASSSALLHRPWTLISYMFTHQGVLHILFNLLWLYWFGQIFLQFFTPKQLNTVYLLGGIFGGLLFIFSYNIFPYFRDHTETSYLIGASASVMAIVFASAFYKKDYRINLLFLGNIRLIYIAFFLFILDFISIDSGNPGGHIAHIGGALMGFCFAQAYTKGKDLTAGINRFLDNIANLFTKKQKPAKSTHRRPETDYEYNKRRSSENKEIDSILDKIKKSGYNSLSENEKKTLFNARR